MTYKRVLWETMGVVFIATFMCITVMIGYREFLPKITEYEQSQEKEAAEVESSIYVPIKVRTSATTVIPLQADNDLKTVETIDDLLRNEIVLRNLPVDETKQISSDLQYCNEIELQLIQDRSDVTLHLTGAYAYLVSIIGDTLVISYEELSKMNEPIVVLDVLPTRTETSLVQSITNMTVEILREQNVYVYPIDSGEDEITIDKKLDFLSEMHASYYLGITFDSQRTVCFYNDKYFLRQYDNARWASDLFSAVSEVTGEEMNLQPIDEEKMLLKRLQIVAAELQLGLPEMDENLMQLDWESIYIQKVSENLANKIQQIITEQKEAE